MDDALQIKDLCVNLGKFELKNINFTVRRGAITGLIGANGAGKSTLIRTIMRAENAVSGSILYGGLRFAGNEKEILTKTACVFDGVNFSEYFKPKKLAAIYSDLYPDFDRKKFDELTEKFRLPQDRRVSKYSFGMKKKLLFSLALCQGADLLILDEPTSGVDPFDRNELTTLLQEFMLDENHAVLFSTHITEDLDKIADYIVMLDGGRVVMDTDKETLLSDYRLVRTANLTPELEGMAVSVVNDAFGYTLLVRADKFTGKTAEELQAEGIQMRTPTVEEVFVYVKKTRGAVGSAGNGNDYADIFRI